MNLKVIGAGFGRTGTHSLKIALEMLGLAPCYHMVEVFSPIQAIRGSGRRRRRSAKISIGNGCSAAIRRPSIGRRVISGASSSR